MIAFSGPTYREYAANAGPVTEESSSPIWTRKTHRRSDRPGNVPGSCVCSTGGSLSTKETKDLTVEEPKTTDTENAAPADETATDAPEAAATDAAPVEAAAEAASESGETAAAVEAETPAADAPDDAAADAPPPTIIDVQPQTTRLTIRTVKVRMTNLQRETAIVTSIVILAPRKPINNRPLLVLAHQCPTRYLLDTTAAANTDLVVVQCADQNTRR